MSYLFHSYIPFSDSIHISCIGKSYAFAILRFRYHDFPNKISGLDKKPFSVLLRECKAEFASERLAYVEEYLLRRSLRGKAQSKKRGSL